MFGSGLPWLEVMLCLNVRAQNVDRAVGLVSLYVSNKVL